MPREPREEGAESANQDPDGQAAQTDGEERRNTQQDLGEIR